MSGSGTVEAQPSTDAATSDLDDRYGRRGLRKGPWAVVIAATVVVAAALVWFVWAAPVQQQSELEWSDLTHSIDSDAQVTTSWRLVVEPGRTVACAVNALNTDYAIVGWRIVDVPASSETVRDLTETLRTSERATNGFVYGCWLT